MSSEKQRKLKIAHAYWDGADTDEIGQELEVLLSNCTTRSEELEKIAELCIPAETPEELYLVSKAYVWAGAKYRQEAIKYLNDYIAAGAFWEGLPDGQIQMKGYVFDQKAGNIASAWSDLGTCYEGEFEYEKAYHCFEKAFSILPYSPSNLVKMSNIFVKKNELSNALSVLQNAKSSIYYKLPEFSSVIDKAILDVQGKINKGYVYKPRKKKQ